MTDGRGYSYQRTPDRDNLADPEEYSEMELLDCPDCDLQFASRSELIEHCNIVGRHTRKNHRDFPAIEDAEDDPVWYLGIGKRVSAKQRRYHTRICGCLISTAEREDINPDSERADSHRNRRGLVPTMRRGDIGRNDVDLCRKCVDGTYQTHTKKRSYAAIVRNNISPSDLDHSKRKQ